jgi:hypothetical protein
VPGEGGGSKKLGSPGDDGFCFEVGFYLVRVSARVEQDREDVDLIQASDPPP